jgi:hypothetical protein
MGWYRQTYLSLLWKQLPARTVNKAVAMLGNVAAYGCLAAPVLLSTGLGGKSIDETTLFNAIGELL